MRSATFVIIILLASLGFSSCGMLSKRYTKTDTSTYRVYAGNKKKIKLDNVNGNFMISRVSDSDAVTIKAFKEIKVKKKFLSTPFDEISIDLDTTAEMISVETNVNQKGSDGLFNWDRGQRVDYEIYIPAGIEIEIDNVNGKIMSTGVSNNLHISLINGDVDLTSYTGRIQCDITNGSFSGKIDSTSGIDISTINGGVTLFLNNYMNANVRAETFNSRITDENLQFRDLMKEKKLLRGKLGNSNSDVDIDIETVNGKIRLFGRNEI